MMSRYTPRRQQQQCGEKYTTPKCKKYPLSLLTTNIQTTSRQQRANRPLHPLHRSRPPLAFPSSCASGRRSAAATARWGYAHPRLRRPCAATRANRASRALPGGAPRGCHCAYTAARTRARTRVGRRYPLARCARSICMGGVSQSADALCVKEERTQRGGNSSRLVGADQQSG